MTFTVRFRYHPSVATLASTPLPEAMDLQMPTTAAAILQDLGLDETEVLVVLDGNYLPLGTVIDGPLKLSLYPLLAGG